MDLTKNNGDMTLNGIKRRMSESLESYFEQLTLFAGGQEKKNKGKGSVPYEIYNM